MSAWNASGEDDPVPCSAQDGWLQKQLFLQCSFAAAPRRPNLSVRQGSVASHSQPLYRVRARLKPSLRSTLGNFGARLTQTAPLEGISPDKSACVNRSQKLLYNGQLFRNRMKEVRVSVSAIPRLPITPKCVTPVRRANRKLCRRRANRLEAIYEIGSRLPFASQVRSLQVPRVHANAVRAERARLPGYYGKRRIQRYRCTSCRATFTEPQNKPLGTKRPAKPSNA